MRSAWWRSPVVWTLAAAGVAGCSGSPSAGDCPSDLPASCPANAAGYAATIAPLIESKCMPCHGPGGASGRLLQTYQQVHDLRGSVLDQVYGCRMPEAGSTPLTLTEREALLGWLVC